MLSAVMILGGLGLVVGIGLAAASKIFYVYVDPMILEVDDALPGANCGGCGLPGCAANAEAIVAGTAAPNSCVAAGPETAEAIAAILGVTVEAKEPDIARAGCTYGVADADVKFIYHGISDCRAAAQLAGGVKVCSIGCLGLGSCERACPFNAIRMGDDGLPTVDEVACTGCGTCERVCPKHIITLSSVTRRILNEYTDDQCTTPCQRACPAGIDIAAYVGQVADGDTAGAVQTIKERNPFPTMIGRICPRPCEDECRRSYVDEPVAINFLKRYAADQAYEAGTHVLPYQAPDTGRKIAIVGGGVEGLSAAFFAARLGHSATVFESTDTLGGLLRSAISRYRLPSAILDWDIDGIRKMGVETQTGKQLGREIHVDDLLAEGFGAVFIATGGWDSRLARGAVVETATAIPGTALLVDFWRTAKQKEAPVGKQMVVVGGGTLALDAARRCMALGAEAVTVVVRESQSASGMAPVAIADAESDGVRLMFNTAVERLTGEGRQLTGVAIRRLDRSADAVLPADGLLLGAGRLPEICFIPMPAEDDGAIPANAPVVWEGVLPYKAPAARDAVGVFSDGDELTDFSGAIKAIAAGRRAAASIHQRLYGIDPQLAENVVTPDTPVQNVTGVENVSAHSRQIMPVCTGSAMVQCGETETGFSPEMAKTEADRCLRCGLICYSQKSDNRAA